MEAAMFLFLQLKVRLNELSNIYQTEFDQSPAQACAIDLPELNYGLWSNYLYSNATSSLFLGERMVIL